MITYVDEEKLRLLAKDFYTVTKLLVTIFDEKGIPISGYNEGDAIICRHIRTIPALDKRCMQCDQHAVAVCKKTRKSYYYHCHMGFVEVMTPIIYNDIILGYVLFGQIVDSQDRTDLIQRAWQVTEEYALNPEVIITGLQEIRYCTTEYLKSATRLLEMCANDICYNNIIQVHRDYLASDISCFIRENLNKELTVADICNRFHIGRSALYELSKSCFGCGITQYIAQLRNVFARELLEMTEHSISEIAEATGFHDVTYFIRFFKKQNGCTPKVYQKQIQQQKRTIDN